MVMGSGASSDVAAAAADVIAADRAFWSKTMDVPVAHGDTATSAKVYVSGGGAVSLTFGDFGHDTSVWTTLPGLRALIGHLMAAAVRAEIAGIETPLPAPPEALDPPEVPW